MTVGDTWVDSGMKSLKGESGVNIDNLSELSGVGDRQALSLPTQVC